VAAIAQEAPASGEPEQEAEENTTASGQAGPAADDIIVTGLRASLASAQSIKRNSDQFVDSVTAIDIGKLPDKNVAEALQRISGIQITRNRGEGSSIAIRGLTQVRTEVNGRDSFGASGGRSLGFEDVPSELLSGVDVYKNPSAELIEGGIGGTVNLRTRMPFDQPGFLFSATMGANHYDLVDDTKFNASALLSDRFDTGIGEIGILFDVSYFKGAFRSDELVVEPYVDTVINGQNVSVPDGAGIGVTYGERERKGYYGAIQWRPNSDIEVYAQAFRSDYYITTPNYTSFVTRGTDAIGVQGLVPLPGFEFDENGVFQAGGFSGHAADWSLAPTWSNRNQLNIANNSQLSYNQSVTTDYSGGVRWQATDRLMINADFQYVKATAENRSYTTFGQHDLASYYLDLRGDLPVIEFGGVEVDPTAPPPASPDIPPAVRPIDINNPAYYRLNALMDHKEDSDANQKSARIDLEWEFDGDFLRSLTGGARYTDRSAVNRSTPYAWSGATATTPLTDPRLLTVPNPFADSFYYGDNGSVGGVPFVSTSALTEGSVAQLFQSVVGRGLTDYSSQDINTQDEQTYAAYAMLRFGFEMGVPIDGNLGVRVLRTENTASGSVRLSYRSDLGPDSTITTVDQPFTESQEYTKVLPSLNLRARLTPTLQARFAASKGLSRPAFYDLRAVRTLSLNYNQLTTPDGTVTGYVPTTLTGSGGNPLLKPLETNNLDVSLEWYPKSTTMLYGTLFYKELKNFTRTAVFDVAYEVPGQGAQTFQFTGLVNGDEGKVKGFEIGGQTFFDFLPGVLSGFGVQGNVTYVDSNAPGAIGQLANGIEVPTTLQGLSKWSYNAVGLYEKGGLTARLAYNWRDRYLDTISGNGTGAVPIYRRAYGQLDASISYDFSPNVSLSLDAVNLLRERKESYQNVETNPRFYQQEDRRIGLTFRVRS
jgi:TonB-dependent receptor